MMNVIILCYLLSFLLCNIILIIILSKLFLYFLSCALSLSYYIIYVYVIIANTALNYLFYIQYNICIYFIFIYILSLSYRFQASIFPLDLFFPASRFVILLAEYFRVVIWLVLARLEMDACSIVDCISVICRLLGAVIE